MITSKAELTIVLRLISNAKGGSQYPIDDAEWRDLEKIVARHRHLSPKSSTEQADETVDSEAAKARSA